MRIENFRKKMKSGQRLIGTFVKTPASELVEILAGTKLDFICLDAEHAPFDRGRLDTCLAMGRALDFPILVRVATGVPVEILQALDSGAVGIVVPHVDSAEKASAVAKAARFGHGGRGYAGSTRWAGFATQTMSDLLRRSWAETVVIVQIEEPEAVEASDAIARTDGIDGLFLGPADLSVAFGKTDQNTPELISAMQTVGHAAKAHEKAYMTFTPDAEKAAEWVAHGFNMFLVSSDQGWMALGANALVDKLRENRS